MKYDQIIQESRIYKYGEKEEFKTREDALIKAKNKENDAKTEIALIKLWDLSQTEIVEENEAFKVVIKIKIPYIFDLNRRNS